MKYIKWSGRILQDLLMLSPDEMIKRYPQHNFTKTYLVQQKHRAKKRIIRLMEKEAHSPEKLTEKQTEDLQRVREILEDFQAHGLPVSPEDAADVHKINMWQTTSVIDGEIVQELNRQVEMKPGKNATEADVIRKVPPVIIRPAKVTRAKSRDKKAIIVPDLQGGYRRRGEELEPIHDEFVVDVGLQIIRHTQPDLIVLNGDNLDFPDLSRFPADSAHFQQVMQATLDRVHEILCEMRASAPDADIVWLAGNHEHRLNKQILQHNSHLWGIKRPGRIDEDSWLSVAHLMNLADPELNVQYISGYPANYYKINDRLQAVHGQKVRSSGSSAHAYAKDEELSTIFGHVHRMETHSRTNRLGRVVTAMSFGTWARIDGAVPSYGNGVDDNGNIVTRYENWQNGMGFVEYQDGDKPFQYQPIHIDHQEGYETHFDGKKFKPNEQTT